jgi:hypothetical protein
MLQKIWIIGEKRTKENVKGEEKQVYPPSEVV